MKINYPALVVGGLVVLTALAMATCIAVAILSALSLIVGNLAALAQMTLLQSAIFDTADIAEAVAAWKAKRDGRFEPLAPVVEP